MFTSPEPFRVLPRLTATCRREVREDVMSSLGLAGAEQILGSMNRPPHGAVGGAVGGP